METSKPKVSISLTVEQLVEHSNRLIAKENGYDYDKDDWLTMIKSSHGNPFKGRCYEIMMAIYELAIDSSQYDYVRAQDFEGKYHWWLVSKASRDAVDPTRQQYILADKECPSDKGDYEVMSKPLWFPSYKTKVYRYMNKLQGFILDEGSVIKPIIVDHFFD